jgi:hypothetical protein
MSVFRFKKILVIFRLDFLTMFYSDYGGHS